MPACVNQLRQAGIKVVLYPLSAFRAMNAAASLVYREIRQKGSQAELLERMQTREQLYKLLAFTFGIVHLFRLTNHKQFHVFSF